MKQCDWSEIDDESSLFQSVGRDDRLATVAGGAVAAKVGLDLVVALALGLDQSHDEEDEAGDVAAGEEPEGAGLAPSRAHVLERLRQHERRGPRRAAQHGVRPSCFPPKQKQKK